MVARAAAATAIGDAVSAGAVPRHANHERTVMAEVGRPPVLGGSQDLTDVFFDGCQIELLKLGRIVEIRLEGVGLGRVLVENAEVDLFGPPVPI